MIPRKPRFKIYKFSALTEGCITSVRVKFYCVGLARRDRKREMTPLFEHLIFDILLRLPTKQLIRFKTICKSWNAFITSPQFIACHNRYSETHYNQSRDRYFTYGRFKNYTADEDEHEEQDRDKVVHMCMILSRQYEGNDSDSDSSSGSSSSSVVSHSLTYVKVKSILDDPNVKDIRICGPCHGLYCLEIDPWLTIGLMNPSLREFKLLPPYDSYLVSEGASIYPYCYGFGFDAVANDYKVVAILSLEIGGWQTVLYSLNSNSWKQVTMPCSTAHLCYQSQMELFCFVNECYHWLFYEIHGEYERRGEDETDGVVVLCFDMVGETFRTIRFPLYNRPWHVTMDSSVSPFELSNGRQTISLILFPGYSDLKKNNFTVWVMKDYEDEESWTKMFVFSFVEAINEPVWWFYEQSELNVVISRDEEKYLLLYNSGAPGLKKFKFHVRWPTCPWRFWHFAAYRESLVSLKRENDIGQLTSFEIE